MRFNALDGIGERFAVAVGQMCTLRWLRSRDCGGPRHGFSQRDQAQRFERKTGRDETSLKAGATVEETKVLRTTRFLAIPGLRQANTGCSGTVVIARLAAGTRSIGASIAGWWQRGIFGSGAAYITTTSSSMRLTSTANAGAAKVAAGWRTGERTASEPGFG